MTDTEKRAIKLQEKIREELKRQGEFDSKKKQKYVGVNQEHSPRKQVASEVIPRPVDQSPKSAV